MRSVQAAAASSALREQAPSAFVKQLHTRLENDREPVESSSKYTAFWLQYGLPLSSQYRYGPEQLPSCTDRSAITDGPELLVVSCCKSGTCCLADVHCLQQFIINLLLIVVDHVSVC